MKIAIRMDDITPDMDWNKFYAAKALLDQHQIKPLIGVVPINKDQKLAIESPKEEFWSMVSQLQKEGWSVALHGYHHLYTTDKSGLFPLNDFSEFAGVALATQTKMIMRGKQVLEEYGISVEQFMAPGHTYDGNTIEALKQCGIMKMTDGFGSYPYCWKGISFYPISFHLERSIAKKNGFTTMVLHTNTMTADDFKRMETLLQEHEKDFISYQEYLAVLVKNRTGFGMLAEYILAKTKFCLVRIRAGKK